MPQYEYLDTRIGYAVAEVIARANAYPGSRTAIIAPTKVRAADLFEQALLAANIKEFDVQRLEAVLRNGSLIYGYSDLRRLRGPQFHTMWIDTVIVNENEVGLGLRLPPLTGWPSRFQRLMITTEIWTDDPRTPTHLESAMADVPGVGPRPAADRAPVLRVGSPVHYMSFGTPAGEYRKACRAAIVTEVGQWVTITTRDAPPSQGRGADPSARKVRELVQVFDPEACAVFVMNPTGVFLNGAGPVDCEHDEPAQDHVPAGGTWHWGDHD